MIVGYNQLEYVRILDITNGLILDVAIKPTGIVNIDI